MSDIIHLLPDSVANQIAAGEVIQRPASVIKELVENAVDAGATSIQIILKDAGRTLIQVIDDGKGMSPTDARLAFERHSTSKIRSADDLFSLRTMGFRGEALASIAAISQVELRTRRVDDEVGSCIRMSASQCEGQEAISTPVGSNFAVKNIFFNVPARRKFLKSNQVELSNILNEFERMALINTQISFILVHNDSELYNLPATNLRQRIVALFGKSLNQQLLSLGTETSLVKISGYVGRPEAARKRGALQYFFVNGRYMRHPYFHKAVTICYEHLIPVGEMPNYFINLTVDPETIDVNIHPTKTEIKFTLPLPFPVRYILPNTDGRGYGLFIPDSHTLPWLLAHWQETADDTAREALLMLLYENYQAKHFTDEEWSSSLLTGLSKEKNPLIASTIIGYLGNPLRTLAFEKKQEMEEAMFRLSETHAIPSCRIQLLRSLIQNATSDRSLQKLYSIWTNQSGKQLNERDYTTLAYILSLRMPEQSKTLLTTQRQRLKNPDRLREFDFISRALPGTD